MKNNFIQESIIIFILLVAVFVLANPFSFFMSDTILMMVAATMSVVFILFAVFVWKEKIDDEREGLHLLIASRIGFLIGGGVLVLGIVVESIAHTLNPWIPLALGGMLLGKIAGIVYTKIRL